MQNEEQSCQTQSLQNPNSLVSYLPQLITWPKEKQRQFLGDLLFPKVYAQCGDLAGYITGMLIEIDILGLSEIINIIEDQELRNGYIQDAKDLLSNS